MKKLAVLGMGVCIVLAFSSCKSSESAYKKAYEKAKQQELAEPQTTTPVEEVAPVVSAPIEAKVNVYRNCGYDRYGTACSALYDSFDYGCVRC